MLPSFYTIIGKCFILFLIAITTDISESVGYFPSAAAKGMYRHHRFLKSPFLRNKKSQEEVQLLPEVGLARKHTGTIGGDTTLGVSDANKHFGHKRSALLLDKLMYALQKAIDEKDESSESSGPSEPSQGTSSNDLASISEMGIGLERRGKSHGKVYWRCYFNAVSCFR